MNDEPVNVMALVKDNGERYFFMYSDANKQNMLQALGRCASDVELSFSWHDAAVLSQKMREAEHPDRFTLPVVER